MKNYKLLLAKNTKQMKKDWQLYVILIPLILFFALFVYRPMYGLIIAFKDYSPWIGIRESAWCGLENFQKFLSSPYLGRLFKNTFLINFYSLIFGFPAPIILALLLNEVRNKKFKSFVQTCSYLPYFISAVVVCGMVTNFLAPENGLINIIIDKFGGEKIYFLTKPEWFRTIFTTMNIWQGVGYSSIVYLSALSGIDMDLYEACVVDGGGRLRQTWHITLPGLRPTIVTLLLIQIGSLLNVGYEKIILLYQPATYETSDVISTYVYRLGIQGDDYAFATAVGLMNSVIAFILVASANYISNKVNDSGLW